MKTKASKPHKYSIAAIKKDFLTNNELYILILPVIAFYVLFCYLPMYGVLISFFDYSPALGVFGSRFVGMKWFESFFMGPYAFQTIRNTLVISIYDILYGFPIPIIFALLINEVENKWYKKTIQTVSYMPYFVSVVVVCGLIRNFVASDGFITNIIASLGGTPENLLLKKEAFRTIFVSSNLWQNMGWNSIVYLAALSGVNPQYYDAATIDGASRFKQVIHITIPSILPTIVIMFILRIGSVMSVSSDKIILLYNSLIYETADVISSFVYRKGLQEYNYSYGTAVGLFNSVINLILVVSVNKISRKLNDTALW